MASLYSMLQQIMAILTTYNVLMDQAVDSNSKLVCIHDSARPLVTAGDVEKVSRLMVSSSFYVAFIML